MLRCASRARLTAVWANTTRDIDEVKRWQADHDKVTAERIIENRTLRGQTEERIKTVEKATLDNDRKQDQVAYRVTVLETSSAAQQQQQQRINEVLSEMLGDLKVVKELMQRQEAASKRLGR